MKKALLIGLVIGVAALWSLPALAIDWTATGWIGTGFLYSKNVPNGNVGTAGQPLENGAAGAGFNDESAYWQMRGRLMLKAQASPDLYGVFYFEMDSNKWGETGGGRNGIGSWGADAAGVEIKHLYVDFRVPPKLPIWLRVGIQPFIVEPNILEVVDGAGVSARISIDPIKLMIRPFWAMQIENNVWSGGDDADMFGIDMSLPIGPVKVGGFFIYEDTRDNALAGFDQSEVYWFGVYASGKISMVNFALDFAYDGGRYDAAGVANDWDFSGWGIRGVADATFGMFNVGMGGMYFSGGNVSTYGATNDYTWFIKPRASEATATLDDSVIFGGWVSEYGPGTGHPSVAPGGWTAPAATNTTYGGWGNIAGMWGIRGFASVQPLSWLKILAQVAYWGDASAGGDTYAGAGFGSGDHNQIGWEYDIGAQVQIYKNLQFKTAFGYLDAGGALRTGGVKPNDPWAWYSSLIYSF